MGWIVAVPLINVGYAASFTLDFENAPCFFGSNGA